MLNEIYEQIFINEGRYPTLDERELISEFCPNGAFGRFSAKINKVTVNDPEIKNIFNAFIKNKNPENSYFTISDISSFRLNIPGIKYARPGDILYIIDRLPEDKKLLKKIEGSLSFNFSDLTCRCPALLIDFDKTGLPFKIGALNSFIYLILKKDNINLITELLSRKTNPIQVGSVTSDRRLRIINNAIPACDVSMDVINSILTAPRQISIENDHYFHKGCYDGLEAVLNCKNNRFVPVCPEKDILLNDFLGYMLGLLYAEVKYNINFIYTNLQEAIKDIENFSVFLLQSDSSGGPWHSRTETVYKTINEFPNKNDCITRVIYKNNTGEKIDELLGVSYLMADALIPFPHAPDGSILYASPVPGPGLYLGRISKKFNEEIFMNPFDLKSLPEDEFLI